MAHTPLSLGGSSMLTALVIVIILAVVDVTPPLMT
jgi:hypothetical protein